MKIVTAILKDSFFSTLKVCKMLFKIIIPVSIIMKIITELGLISYIGQALSPLMSLVGLPGSYGLVWAAAICTNIYAAMLVFSKVITTDPINTAQVTILGIMMLVAHALPIEATVARQSGIRLRVSLLFRLVSALLFGMLLNFIFKTADILQNSPNIIWYPENNASGLLPWAGAEFLNYIKIVIIIFSLITFMNILKASGFMNVLIKVLYPLLKGLGIGKKAIPITIIGIVLGYAYGGGLIIAEAKSGRVGKKDLFYTIIFLSLCHSLIEDSFLIISLGGDSITIILGRFILSYITCTIIVFATRNMQEELFLKLFFRQKK
jgi:hypothetical protein